MPKVSVIVPVYNAEQTVGRCWESLAGQTERDIEVIFVDDCSTDGSLRMLQGFAEADSRCRVLRTGHNGGPALARKVGLNAATGDYVIGCDADDYVEPYAMENLLEAAVGGGNLDIVWCDFYKNDGHGWHVVSQRPATTGAPIDKEAETRSLLLGHRQGAVWNHLVSRSLLVKVTEHPVRNMAEDLALLLQLYLVAKSVGYVAKALYYYGYSAQGLSQADGDDASRKLVRQAEDMEENTKLLERVFRKQGIYDKFKDALLFRKFFNKRWMLPALHTMADCRLWRNIHKDINLSLFRSPLISKGDKVSALLCLLGLYPALKSMLKGR